jgi:hypothetical protein
MAAMPCRWCSIALDTSPVSSEDTEIREELRRGPRSGKTVVSNHYVYSVPEKDFPFVRYVCIDCKDRYSHGNLGTWVV